MRHLLFFLTLITLSPLHAECVGCIKHHKEPQPNGQCLEWTEKKCLLIKDDIDGDTCQCGCPKGVHSRTRQPWRYHNGKKLPIRSLKQK